MKFIQIVLLSSLFYGCTTTKSVFYHDANVVKKSYGVVELMEGGNSELLKLLRKPRKGAVEQIYFDFGTEAIERKRYNLKDLKFYITSGPSVRYNLMLNSESLVWVDVKNIRTSGIEAKVYISVFVKPYLRISKTKLPQRKIVFEGDFFFKRNTKERYYEILEMPYPNP